MIDRDTLLNWPFEEIVQRYTVRDTQLYALSLGFGDDPMDAGQLRHVLENGLRPFPTMALVLAHPGPWTANPATGVNRSGVVHGEQRLTLHRRLLVEGAVRSRARVVAVLDKGEGKGAVIQTERQLHDVATGDLLATIAGSTFCRRDGGFDKAEPPPTKPATPAPPAVPDRAPDATAELPTRPQAALLYRLNGDYNPLHADPAVARNAGFERPITHGLLSFGMAARMLEERFPPAGIASIGARFAAPMVPGETLQVQMWQEGGEVVFRALCKERQVVVLSHGRARLARDEELS
ncbi:MaoC/PaaZ C-terminal domain-containing protein [Hydrogenophaga palleronii]|uniref:MaoC/PaaZ C-terminal domain-containing protein n=1 Tax=Hydrogenophaga palleronii TaxID=65655 RepID=UPI00082557C7|nr:MaoC/PaaZ C-terminal domain-containing protein [Hydrogenophaga palleronii]